MSLLKSPLSSLFGSTSAPAAAPQAILRTTHLESRVVPAVVLASTTFNTATAFNTFNGVVIDGAVAQEVVPFATDGTTPVFLQNGKPIGGSLLGLWYGNRQDGQGPGFVIRRLNVDGTAYEFPQGGNQELRLSNNDTGVTGEVVLNTRADGTYAFIVAKKRRFDFQPLRPEACPVG